MYHTLSLIYRVGPGTDLQIEHLQLSKTGILIPERRDICFSVLIAYTFKCCDSVGTKLSIQKFGLESVAHGKTPPWVRCINQCLNSRI